MTDVKQKAEQLEDWTLDGEKISRTFKFDKYLDGIAFVEKLAVYAESVQHHPHLTIDHTNVTILWTTVYKKALTEKDIAGAKAADNLYKT